MTNVYWLEQTESDVPTGNDWFSASEAVRLEGLRIAKRRGDWRLGRWTAKCALASYLHLPDDGLTLASIEIRPAASGAPEAFLNNQPAAATISLSHRDGTAACAVAPPGVVLGCDLEIIEPRSDAFVTDYFTPEEQALVVQVSAADRSRMVTVLWSAKESTLKALKAGLRLDTRQVMVSVQASVPEPSWSPLQVRYAKNETFHGWWQSAGQLVRVLVACPPPAPPMQLISNNFTAPP